MLLAIKDLPTCTISLSSDGQVLQIFLLKVGNRLSDDHIISLHLLCLCIVNLSKDLNKNNFSQWEDFLSFSLAFDSEILIYSQSVQRK